MIDILFLSDMVCHAAKTLRYWSFTWNGRWMRAIYLAISCTMCSLALPATIMANTLHLLSLTTTGIESWPCKQHRALLKVSAVPLAWSQSINVLFHLVYAAPYFSDHKVHLKSFDFIKNRKCVLQYCAPNVWS